MPRIGIPWLRSDTSECLRVILIRYHLADSHKKTLKSNYQKDLLGRLLLLYLGGNAGSAFVLTKLWQVNPEFLTKSIFEMYGNDATSLSRILDIAHELKVINSSSFERGHGN